MVFLTESPDIDLRPQIAKAASNKGETGRLICRARGSPNGEFNFATRFPELL